MDVHPPKNGIYRYWSIAIFKPRNRSKLSNWSFSSFSSLLSLSDLQELAIVSATAIPYKRVSLACAESRLCTPCSSKCRCSGEGVFHRKVRATRKARFCSASAASRCEGLAQVLNHCETSEDSLINSSTKAKTTGAESWLPSGTCQMCTARSCWMEPHPKAGRKIFRRLPAPLYAKSSEEVLCKTAPVASRIAQTKLRPAEGCSSESFAMIWPTTPTDQLHVSAFAQRCAANTAALPLSATRAKRSMVVGVKSVSLFISRSQTEDSIAATKRCEYVFCNQSENAITVAEQDPPKAWFTLSGRLHNHPLHAWATSSLKSPRIKALTTASRAAPANQIWSMCIGMTWGLVLDFSDLSLRKADKVPPRTRAAINGLSWLIFTTVLKKSASVSSASGWKTIPCDARMAFWAIDPASSAGPERSNSFHVFWEFRKSAKMSAKCCHPCASASTWCNCSKLS